MKRLTVETLLTPQSLITHPIVHRKINGQRASTSQTFVMFIAHTILHIWKL